MKYLCLAYEDEAFFGDMPRAEWDVLRNETIDYVDTLRRNGHLVSTEPLQSARTAVTVRVRDQRLQTVDGPFAETKEQLGGYFLIEAKDLNEAIQIAAKWPSARFGTIEVRPLQAGLPEDKRYG
ncbi:MAG TPA: YciI family protein [Candidatus Binatia bacterium]|jgi:hypothetical protein|nr:YciI family protein [Candidatus Binatia bacterium]